MSAPTRQAHPGCPRGPAGAREHEVDRPHQLVRDGRRGQRRDLLDERPVGLACEVLEGAVSSNETLCFQIMKDNRQQSSSATVQAFQVALCNVLFFLKAAGERYGLTATLLDGVRAAG